MTDRIYPCERCRWSTLISLHAEVKTLKAQKLELNEELNHAFIVSEAALRQKAELEVEMNERDAERKRMIAELVKMAKDAPYYDLGLWDEINAEIEVESKEVSGG